MSAVRAARADAVFAHVIEPNLLREIQWPEAPVRLDGLLFAQLRRVGLTRDEVARALDDLVEAGRVVLGVEGGYVTIRPTTGGAA
jgi:hypothetical protein